MRAHYLMNDMGLKSHVDGIIYSAQLGVSKPDTRFYARACQSIDAEPSQILLVDDLLANVTAAKGASWQAHQWIQKSSIADLILNL